MMTLSKLVSWILAVYFGLAFNSLAAIPAPEKLLPEDTLVMVTAPDFARLRELWKNCPQTRLWTDPAMKPFKDKFLAKWKEELITPLERDLGVKFQDYTNLPQGQVTFALTQNGWQGSGEPSPAWLLLLDTKDKKDQLKKILNDLRKKWVDSGKSIRTEKLRGVEFSVVQVSSADVPKTLHKAFSKADSEEPADAKETASPGTELAVGQFESLLIVGNSTKAVDKIVVHLTGGAMPALSDLASYEANRLALFREAPLYGWVNLKEFLDVLNRKSPDSEEESGPNPLAMLNPGKMVTAVGLGGLKTLAFNFQNTQEGSTFQVVLGVPESGRQGILKLFPARGKEAAPPPFVPLDAVKFRRHRVDGQKAWATLQAVMNDINPQLLSGLNFLLDTANSAARQKDPDFDIRKSLFGNLGDDMISYQKAPRGKSVAESASPPSIFLISSPQPEQLATAIKSIGVLWNPQGGPVAEREFLGRKIFSLPLPGASTAGSDTAKSAAHTVSCAASGGYVAVSMDAAILEEYLRSGENQQKALRDRPGLTEAAAKTGGTSTGWFGYENQAETTRVLFEQLRNIASSANSSTSSAALLGAGFPGGPNGFKDWLDFTLLPPFDKVSRYFYFSVYTASANADGFMFKLFAPTPPGLKK